MAASDSKAIAGHDSGLTNVRDLVDPLRSTCPSTNISNGFLNLDEYFKSPLAIHSRLLQAILQASHHLTLALSFPDHTLYPLSLHLSTIFISISNSSTTSHPSSFDLLISFGCEIHRKPLTPPALVSTRTSLFSQNHAQRTKNNTQSRLRLYSHGQPSRQSPPDNESKESRALVLTQRRMGDDGHYFGERCFKGSTGRSRRPRRHHPIRGHHSNAILHIPLLRDGSHPARGRMVRTQRTDARLGRLSRSHPTVILEA